MSKKEKIILALLIGLVLLRIIFLDYNARQAEKKANQILRQLKQLQEFKGQEMFLVKEEFLDDDNNVYAQVKYKYNKQGDLIKVDYINAADEVIESKRYQYNEEGLKEKMILKTEVSNWQEDSWRFASKDMTKFRSQREIADFTSLRCSSVAEYEYNDLGDLIYYKKVDENGDSLRKIEIEYYDNGDKKEVLEEKGINYFIKSKYNQKGQLEKRIIEDNFFIELREYRYDEQGNEIKVIMERRNNKNQVTSQRLSESVYNQQGEKLNDRTITKSYVNDQQIKKYYNYQYKYDSKGNKIETIALDESEQLLERIIYDYDSFGNKISEKRQQADGTITYHFVNEYQVDTENNTIIVKRENLLDNKIIKDEYHYDEFANLIRVKTRNEQGEVEKNKRYSYH